MLGDPWPGSSKHDRLSCSPVLLDGNCPVCVLRQLLKITDRFLDLSSGVRSEPQSPAAGRGGSPTSRRWPTWLPSGSARSATLTSLAGQEWGWLGRFADVPRGCERAPQIQLLWAKHRELGIYARSLRLGGAVGFAGIIGTAGLRDMTRLNDPSRAGRK